MEVKCLLLVRQIKYYQLNFGVLKKKLKISKQINNNIWIKLINSSKMIKILR